MNSFAISSTELLYQRLIKPTLFHFDPEKVHVATVGFGECLGLKTATQEISASLFVKPYPSLSQTIAGIRFKTPIGLAAGFDYEGRLTQILPFLGFGFQTIGTITNHSYEGNMRPMLGRLPKSKSLMVNKGFKNLGAVETIKKLERLEFPGPVGISVGRTNSLELKTQHQSISDIVQTFTLFEKSNVHHSYYELNISCPNLMGNITFYPPQNLDELLTSVDKLKIKKPIFVKMPIEKSDEEFIEMLKVIAKHSPAGIIVGNLQKNRQDPSLHQDEVAKFTKGNFSGKPTFNRSNELISLTSKLHAKKLIIIGCGGIFSAEDAWEKIRRGASLVQLITGMVYQGPQLVAQINEGLNEYLHQNKLENISRAIGANW